MKSQVHFPIPEGSKISISVGDKISPNTVLAENPSQGKDEIIEISKILKIKPVDIPKYLKKRIGDFVDLGDVIARKSGLFSSLTLKSPFSGKIKEIDLKKGSMTIIANFSDSLTDKIVSPIEGWVKEIKDKNIIIETDKSVFTTINGHGREVKGKIKFLKSLSKIGVLEVTDDVDGLVILCKEITREALAKLEALDAVAVIVVKAENIKSDIPWVQVKEEVFEKLKEKENREILIKPMDNILLMLD